VSKIEQASLFPELLVGRTDLAKRPADSGHQLADHQSGCEEYDQRCEVQWVGHRNGERWRDEEIAQAQYRNDGHQRCRSEAPCERQEHDDAEASQHGHRDAQPEPIAHHGHEQHGGGPQENLGGRAPGVTCCVLPHRNALLMVQAKIVPGTDKVQRSLLRSRRSRVSRGESGRGRARG
jgi:hypothetical protein